MFISSVLSPVCGVISAVAPPALMSCFRFGVVRG